MRNWRRLLALPTFLALMLTLVVPGVRPVEASGVTVSPGANAITNATASATSGTVITVEAGTYNEHGITILQGVTLQCATVGQCIVDGGG